ncbi:MAG: hypothetical protein ACD_22C00189G0004 [uncultured bacterium]|nr:MAG: hypothetical protein ACD_22C00189G0004 [uncultured bacterium]
MRFINYLKKQKFLAGEVWRRAPFYTVTLLVFVANFVWFKGLIKNCELPGWDTPGHYYVLQKVVSALESSHNPQNLLNIYDTNWFGGIELFKLYTPLYYWLVAVFWLITFKIIPLALLFRLSLFLLINLFPLVFWYFCRVYIDSESAKWAFAFSIFFVFFPINLSSSGIGAGSLTYMGLIPGFMGLLLAMLSLTFLRQIHLSGHSTSYSLLFAVSFSALVLTHILSTVFVLPLIVTYILIHTKSFFLRIKNFAVVLLVISVLTLPWAVPFITHLPDSAGKLLTVNSVYLDTLLVLFPINTYMLQGAGYIVYFRLWVVFIAGLVFFAVISKLHEKKISRLVVFFLITYFLWTTNIIPILFKGEFRLHFHRALPLLFVCILGICVYYFAFLMRETGVKTGLFLTTVLFVCQLNAVSTYNFVQNEYNDSLNSYLHRSVGDKWRWEEYPYYEEANQLLAYLAKTDFKRVFIQSPESEYMLLLGSSHFFTGRVPGVNNQSIITGLFAEASPLTPYIMGSIYALTDGETQTWGDTRLEYLDFFQQQKTKRHLERLRFLGVDGVAAFSNNFKKTMADQSAAKVYESKHFSVYALNDPQPNIFVPKTEPFFFVSGKGGVPFEDICDVLYTDSKTYELSIFKVKLSDLSDFTGVVIATGDFTDQQQMELFARDNTILLINPSINVARFILGRKATTITIDNFVPLSSVPLGNKEKELEGWGKLKLTLLENTTPLPTSPESAPTLSTVGNRWKVVAKKNPYVILRYGYSKSIGVETKDVETYKSSPGFIGIFNPLRFDSFFLSF